MNGYDFDNTLYKGESPFDFFLFCFRKKRGMIKYFPTVLIRLIQYKRTKLPVEKVIETVEEIAHYLFQSEEQLNQYVKEFWEKNQKKLKEKIIAMVQEEDIIITASPRFLIEGISEQLKAKKLICTEFNVKTGKLEFLCYKEKKLERFLKCYPKQTLKAFYSDSLNDLEMMNYAKEAYLVKGNKIEKILPKKDL